MSSIPVLIITGLSCTGKTTCARRLSTRCNLPVFGKDILKELLFDSLGYQDVAWSKRVDAAAYAILYQLFEAHLKVGKSCILESDFRPPAATPIFQGLMERHNFMPIQLHLVANPEEILRRFQQRVSSGARHPGHCDDLNLSRFAEKVRTMGDPGPLEIGGDLLRVDTTHFQDSDWDALAERIVRLLS